MAPRTYQAMRAGVVAVTALLAVSCSEKPSPAALDTQSSGSETTILRVYHSPYSGVNWSTFTAVKAQQHDHVGDNGAGLLAYDAAGYQVVSLMTYSGVASLSYSWHERHWPPQAWIAQKYLDAMKNIKVFVPNGEEVGFTHFTSPFMTTYIAKWEPGYYTERKEWHYSSIPEMTSEIVRYGGFPILAHPVGDWSLYANMTGYAGVEVYDALYAVNYRLHKSSSDQNADMISNWDEALKNNQSIIGIGVNDHYGPNLPLSDTVPADLRDSGKIIAWVAGTTLSDYEAAFRAGALVAIKDIGSVKDLYPHIRGITVSDSTISLTISEPDAKVQWIANGKKITTGPKLELRLLPTKSLYVRAELSNAEGSTVYTQAFVLRAVGDTNGDGVRNAADQTVCVAVKALSDTIPDHVDACRALGITP